MTSTLEKSRHIHFSSTFTKCSIWNNALKKLMSLCAKSKCLNLISAFKLVNRHSLTCSVLNEDARMFHNKAIKVTRQLLLNRNKYQSQWLILSLLSLPKSLSYFRFLAFAESNATAALEIISIICTFLNRQAFLVVFALPRKLANRFWDIWSAFEFVFVNLGHLSKLRIPPIKFSPKLVFWTIGLASERIIKLKTKFKIKLPRAL